MITVNDVMQVVRRRIGDTETPFTFEDDLLYGYVSDAVAQVEMDWNRNIAIESTTDTSGGTPVTTYDFNTTDLVGADAQLFAIKAHYLITLRTKGKADRDNFRMVKGRLTLDNTNQADDHADTLRLLEQEYRTTLRVMKNGGLSIKGVRVE